MAILKTTVTIHTELNEKMDKDRASGMLGLFFAKLERSTNDANAGIRVDLDSMTHVEEDVPFEVEEEEA